MAVIPSPGDGTPTFGSWGRAVAAQLNKPPGCMLKRASVYNAINGTLWTIPFPDAEERDVGGFHSTTTNTDRVIVPAGLGGLYSCLFTGFWNVASVSGGVQRWSGICKNGTTDIVGLTVPPNPNAYHFNCVRELYLVPGDYVMAGVYQDMSGPCPVENARFSVRLVALDTATS